MKFGNKGKLRAIHTVSLTFIFMLFILLFIYALAITITKHNPVTTKMDMLVRTPMYIQYSLENMPQVWKFVPLPTTCFLKFILIWSAFLFYKIYHCNISHHIYKKCFVMINNTVWFYVIMTLTSITNLDLVLDFCFMHVVFGIFKLLYTLMTTYVKAETCSWGF